MKVHPLVKLIGLVAALLVAIGCNNVKVSPLGDTIDVVRIDTSEPVGTNAIDLLWVIDDSGSMEAEQVALNENFDAFVEALIELDADFRIAVVTTSRNTDGRFQTIPWAAAPELRPAELDYCLDITFDTPYLTRDRYVDPDDPDQEIDAERLKSEFRCIATAGIRGDGIEAGLEVMFRALNDDNLNGPNQNFLRDDAFLGVIFLTDEDDCSSFGQFSPGQNDDCYVADERDNLTPVATFIDFLVERKGGNAEQVLVAGILGPDDNLPAPTRQELRDDFGGQLLPSCISELASEGGDSAQARAQDGERYRELIDAFDDRGVIESICQADFANALSQIGDVIRDNLDVNCLNDYPETCNSDSDCADGVACLPQGLVSYCADFEILLEVSSPQAEFDFEPLVPPGPVGQSEPNPDAQYVIDYDARECPSLMAFAFQNGGRPSPGARFRASYPTEIRLDTETGGTEGGAAATE